MNWTWSLRGRDGGMNGLEFGRYLTAGGLHHVLVHAAPASLSVEVVADDRSLVAAGDVDREGDYSPITELRLVDGSVERREVWPDDGHLGLPVLLPGGEAGVLTAWRHAEDRTWWQWSVELSNHKERPADWAPAEGKLRR